MRAPKIYLPNTVIFYTCSLEEGILLCPNPLVKLVILSCLAFAYSHHPIKICHYFVSGNHIHFLIYVENPDDIAGFFERFKTESAHRINNLLGRNQRTVWCAGSASPTVLDPETAIDRIAYIYANASADALEDNIGKYPGLNSWGAFIGDFIEHRSKCSYIKRGAVPQIGTAELSLREYKIMARQLSTMSKVVNQFVVTPMAWLKAFNLDSKSYVEIKRTIIREVQSREREARSQREKEGMEVMGREKLIRQALNPSFQSTRDGKKMQCLAADKELRKSFLGHVKDLVDRARTVVEKWKQGDYSLAFPLGLFPPAFPKQGNSLLFFFDFPFVATG